MAKTGGPPPTPASNGWWLRLLPRDPVLHPTHRSDRMHPPAIPGQMPERRLAVVLGHSDGDQPLTLAALVAAGPIPELPA